MAVSQNEYSTKKQQGIKVDLHSATP